MRFCRVFGDQFTTFTEVFGIPLGVFGMGVFAILYGSIKAVA